MSSGNDPASWEKKASDLVADCRVFKILKNRFRHPVRGDEGDFYSLDAPDWVTVVAITENHELVTVSQYRFGIEALSLEVPAGLVDAGEDPLETGVRELREETGFVGENARVLDWVYPNPAIQTNRCFVVLVENARQTGSTEWDEHEELETRLIPIAEIGERMKEGLFRHSLSICALSYFQLHQNA